MRKLIKRSVVVLLAGVLLFSLSGCKKKQKKDEVQRYAWPLGTSSPEDTVTQLYAEKFAKEVSKLSHGKMKIEVYPNSTLGGDRELLESCKDGDIPFVVQNTAPQVTFLPDTAVFDLPSAFTTIKQAREAVDNEEFYQKMEKSIRRVDTNYLDMPIRDSVLCLPIRMLRVLTISKDRRSVRWRTAII